MNSSKPAKKGSKLYVERGYRELILYVPFFWLITDRTPSQTDLRNEESLLAHINVRFRVVLASGKAKSRSSNNVTRISGRLSPGGGKMVIRSFSLATLVKRALLS